MNRIEAIKDGGTFITFAEEMGKNKKRRSRKKEKKIRKEN